MKWMFKKDAPLLFNPSPSLEKYKWIIGFLAASFDGKHKTKTQETIELAKRARELYYKISDEEGLRSEAEEGKNMGYDGKTLIHPNQIGITNAVFSPTEKEIDLANKIIEAYEKAKEEKSGVTTVDGVLVEELHVKQSLALISKMKMIQSMS